MDDGALDFETVGIERDILRDGENWRLKELLGCNDGHLWSMMRANSFTGNVFKTSAASSQPLRAMRTPYCMLARCFGWCASVLITNLHPFAFAARMCDAVRSSRSGLELVSIYTFLRRASVAMRL